MEVKIEELRALSCKLLEDRGLTTEEAGMVVDHLLQAELSGRPSHGFIRVPRICQALEKANLKEITTVTDTPISAVLDGGQRPGFVVAFKATEIALQKAKSQRIAVVGGFNSDNIGIAGYYVRHVARQGYIAIMTANSPSKVPPWGGVEPIMGTNPLAIAIPTHTEPLVLDFASSKMTFGDVLLAAAKGELIEPGILLDKDGHATTNPNDVRSGGIGSILAIGDHKGAGLALVLEILAGPLVNAKGGMNAVPEGGWGFFMLVFDPTLLTSRETLYSKIDKMITEIKNVKRAPGFDEILLPGERTANQLRENANRSMLEVPETVLEEIRAMKKNA